MTARVLRGPQRLQPEYVGFTNTHSRLDRFDPEHNGGPPSAVR
jgi:hypothetical protein